MLTLVSEPIDEYAVAHTSPLPPLLAELHATTWERMGRLEARWLPPARITHPWPNVRFDARTQGRSPVR